MENKRRADELAAVSGPAAGEVYALPAPGQRMVLGRGGECDAILLDGELSRMHLIVESAGDSRGDIIIRDLGSKNGTFIQRPMRSGQPGQPEPKFRLEAQVGHILEPGGRLFLGASVLHYRHPAACSDDRGTGALAPPLQHRTAVEIAVQGVAWLILTCAAAAFLWLLAPL